MVPKSCFHKRGRRVREIMCVCVCEECLLASVLLHLHQGVDLSVRKRERERRGQNENDSDQPIPFVFSPPFSN